MKRKRGARTWIVVTIAVVFVAASAAVVAWKMRPRPQAPLEKTVETDVLTVYMPTPSGKLEKGLLQVKKGTTGKGVVDAVIAEMKRAGAVQAGVTVQDCTMDSSGVMYLSLSKEILEDRSDSLKEVAGAYAIVNSLIANIRGLARVQFLVEGKPVYTFEGTLLTYIPLEFNKDLLED
jgi:hypothetical protein